MTPISGKPWSVSWEVSGTVTASTAPTLFIDGVSSGASVTWTTSVAGVVTATVTLSGVNPGQTVQFRGGSVTVGTAYSIASSVRTVQTDQHIVFGTSQIATPIDLDIVLAAGDAAKVVLGSPIFLGGMWRVPTQRGAGGSVNEISLNDTTGLTPASVAYTYVQPWESARLAELPAAPTDWLNADGLADDAAIKVADNVLTRSVSNVESVAGEHTLATIILAMLEHSISGVTLTIRRTDGVTIHLTKPLTKDAAALPITGIS
jgi:hypothetical protein